MLIALVYLSANNLNQAFVYLGDKLENTPKQISPTLATEIIRHLGSDPYQGLPPTSCHPSPIYLCHQLLFM